MMKVEICFILSLLFSVPAWSQVVSPILSSGQTPGSSMQIPGPVNINYSGSQLGSEEMSNYIQGSLAASGSYVDNIFAGGGLGTHSETIISLMPTITYNWTRPTQSRLLSYSPGYLYYQPNTSLNQFSQTASAAYQIRPAEHVTLVVNDIFSDTSNIFGPGNQNAIPSSYTPQIVPFFAAEMSNVAQGEIAVQTGRDVMVGASGIVSMLHYPKPSQTAGLFDSSSRGGSAFYSRRLTRNQYLGFEWQYVDYLIDVQNANGTVKTNGFVGFYALSLTQQLTFSVAAGPQHYLVKEAPLPAAAAWAPTVSVALGWHLPHVGLSLSGSRETTGGGGELGAFTTSHAAVAAQWQMARTWSAGMSGNYTDFGNTAGSFQFGHLGGHSISGGAILYHALGRAMTFSFAYNRLHQRFQDISSITANPNSNTETLAVAWHFTRPLGH